jgi:hypothetical protein
MRQRRFHRDRYAHEVRDLTRFPALVGIFTTLVGCAGSVSPAPRTGATGSPAPDVTTRDSAIARSPAAFIYQPGELQYRVQVSSAVQLIGSDSIHRIDSTRVIGNLTVRLSTVSGRDQILAEVRSDSMLLTIGAGTSVPMASGMPLVFHIDLHDGRVMSSEPAQNTSCTQDSKQELPFSGREVLPSIHLQPVNTWVDTSATTMCRDGILLVVTRVASYIRRESSDSARQLLRSTRVTVAGMGSQWGQQVEVTGEGAATDTLYLSGAPLRLRESVGSSHLQLRFHASLKTQEFVQTTTTRVLLHH